MYLVADINVDICAATSCKLCTQYCPEANTIQYNDNLGKEHGISTAPLMWRSIGVRDVRNASGCATTCQSTTPSRWS